MKESLHVGFLTPEYSRDAKPDGGLGNYLRKVALELCSRGIQVSVFCLSKTNRQWQDGEISVCEIKSFSFPSQIARLKVAHPFLAAVAQIRSARRLENAVWKLHREHPIDILQASSYKSPGYTLRRNLAIPLVCRISSYAPLRRSASGHKRTFSEYLCDWLEIRQVLDAVDSFGPSEFMSNVFARLEGYRPRVIRTLATLEEIRFDPSFYEQNLKGEAYLLYFGTLSGIKGVDLLARVVSQLLPQHPTLKFVFIGRDDGLPDGEKVCDFIWKVNKSHDSRLFYHPALPKSQLYPVIANALGVLMPSRVDNLPNACLEAQALGIPVVGTRDSSLEEMISDGETGFLAQNGDWEDVAAATERLLRLTQASRAEMRARVLASVARAKAEDRVGQLVDFYEETIANWRKARYRK